jgi:DNA-binding MarR family transcriptional regulator
MADTETPNWLDPDEMRAWRAYVETVGHITTELERDLAPTGLTLGDYQVLVYLSETADQHMRMCDLAGLLQLSPSGMTRRIDGLVKAGWVARVPSPDDRRVMHAQLTPAGFRALVDAAPIHLASVRRVLIDHLTRRQLAELADAFETVHDALRPGARITA